MAPSIRLTAAAVVEMNEQTLVTRDVDPVDADAVNSRTERPLYAARVKVFPQAVSGLFRRLKWWIVAVTLGIYWLTPWLRWDRGPNAPDQGVLVDLANRRGGEDNVTVAIVRIDQAL